MISMSDSEYSSRGCFNPVAILVMLSLHELPTKVLFAFQFQHSGFNRASSCGKRSPPGYILLSWNINALRNIAVLSGV
jgi:hypothetical protein